MSFPPPSPTERRYTLGLDQIVADWNCPMCGTPTPRVRRPGRPRVYCTNSCRQRAYRHRRRHGIRKFCDDRQPSPRSVGAPVSHLLRAPGDPIGDRRTSRGTTVSLCGAFVRPAHDHPDLVTEFLYDGVSACYSCLELTGSERPSPPMIYPWQTSRKSYTGPPLPKIPADPDAPARLRGHHRRPRPKR